MVISLILFRCAKHSILPRKTGTWEKRVPSSYGQNSIAQSHKMQYLFFLYHSLLTIQHKILFQRLSGFDNKQQISDLCWKENNLSVNPLEFNFPEDHSLLAHSMLLNHRFRQSEKRNNALSQMRIRSVFKMRISILNTATTEQMGYGIISFFVCFLLMN